eukprot:gene16936-20144_t
MAPKKKGGKHQQDSDDDIVDNIPQPEKKGGKQQPQGKKGGKQQQEVEDDVPQPVKKGGKKKGGKHQQDDDSEEEKTVVPPPAAKKAAPAKKGGKQQQQQDSEDEEETIPQPVKKAAPPAKKGGKKGRQALDDQEDEDNDVVDDIPQPAKKGGKKDKKKGKQQVLDDEDEEMVEEQEEEEEHIPQPAKKGGKKDKKKGKQAVVEEEEELEQEEEEEIPQPTKKSSKKDKKKGKQQVVEEEPEEEEQVEEEPEEEIPQPTKKSSKKDKKKSKHAPVEEEEEVAEEEEEIPQPTKKSSKKKGKKVVEEEPEEEEQVEEEEEEKPKKKRSSKSASTKLAQLSIDDDEEEQEEEEEKQEKTMTLAEAKAAKLAKKEAKKNLKVEKAKKKRDMDEEDQLELMKAAVAAEIDYDNMDIEDVPGRNPPDHVHLKSGSGARSKIGNDIKIDNYSMSVPGKILLQNASLTLAYGQKYGFVGRNGIGKSTLVKKISERDEIVIAPHLRVLYVEQEVTGDDNTPLQCVLKADVEREWLIEEEKVLVALERENPSWMYVPREKRNYTLRDIYDRLREIDSDRAAIRASAILVGLGFTAEEIDTKPSRDYSGGWRMRIALARALFCKPEVLLLDEPSNHLDLHACVWLEKYLNGWDRTLLVVSHEATFLNEVVDNIIHIHDQRLDQYRGNYDDFVKQRAVAQRTVQKKLDKQETKLKKDKEFINKSKYSTQAKQAASRQRKIDKIEIVTVEREDKSLVVSFPTPEHLTPPLLRFDDVDFGYEGRPTIFKNLEIGVDMDSKVALVGMNGVGKSTLMKLMAGELKETRGYVEKSRKMRLARFSQHFVDQLNTDQTPIEYFQTLFNNPPVQDIRNHLGRFGISGNLPTHRITTLSGGQKSRVILAELAWVHPHILLLDEPTNHLDIDAIEALADGINEFEGGVVLISHNQHLINKVANEIWVVKKDGTVTKLPKVKPERPEPEAQDKQDRNTRRDYYNINAVNGTLGRYKKPVFYAAYEPQLANKSDTNIKKYHDLHRKRELTEEVESIRSDRLAIEGTLREFATLLHKKHLKSDGKELKRRPEFERFVLACIRYMLTHERYIDAQLLLNEVVLVENTLAVHELLASYTKQKDPSHWMYGFKSVLHEYMHNYLLSNESSLVVRDMMSLERRDWSAHQILYAIKSRAAAPLAMYMTASDDEMVALMSRDNDMFEVPSALVFSEILGSIELVERIERLLHRVPTYHINRITNTIMLCYLLIDRYEMALHWYSRRINYNLPPDHFTLLQFVVMHELREEPELAAYWNSIVDQYPVDKLKHEQIVAHVKFAYFKLMRRTPSTASIPPVGPRTPPTDNDLRIIECIEQKNLSGVIKTLRKLFAVGIMPTGTILVRAIQFGESWNQKDWFDFLQTLPLFARAMLFNPVAYEDMLKDRIWLGIQMLKRENLTMAFNNTYIYNYIVCGLINCDQLDLAAEICVLMINKRLKVFDWVHKRLALQMLKDNKLNADYQRMMPKFLTDIRSLIVFHNYVETKHPGAGGMCGVLKKGLATKTVAFARIVSRLYEQKHEERLRTEINPSNMRIFFGEMPDSVFNHVLVEMFVKYDNSKAALIYVADNQDFFLSKTGLKNYQMVLALLNLFKKADNPEYHQMARVIFLHFADTPLESIGRGPFVQQMRNIMIEINQTLQCPEVAQKIEYLNVPELAPYPVIDITILVPTIRELVVTQLKKFR